MRPQYISLAAAGVRVVPLDTNKNNFNVTVRAPGATVEQTLDNVQEIVNPVWSPAPAAVDGLINLGPVVGAVRITAVGAITAVVLQNGIQ